MKRYIICILITIVLYNLHTGAYADVPTDVPAEGAIGGMKEEVTDQVKSGAGRKLLNFTKAGLKWVPGGGYVASALDSVTGGGLEDKVDRIEQRQKTSIDHIRDIALKALDTKRKVEDMYYFKKRSQREAMYIAEGLRKGKKRKFLGAIIEDGLKVPINPAEYVPDIPPNKKLKENLDFDLSFEKSMIRSSNHLVSYTRSHVLSYDLIKTNPKRFEKEYGEAEEYEANLKKAIKAKKIATTKIYVEDIKRLEKELELLEDTKTRKGLTVGDVMLIEMAMDSKRREIRDLGDRIDAALLDDLKLSEEDAFKIGCYKAQKDGKEMLDAIEKDKQRMLNNKKRK